MQENISNVVLRDYNPNQTMILPPSLEELLPANHPARTVSVIVDKQEGFITCAREKLTLAEDLERRKIRATDVEPVFGQLKHLFS